jgi:hypothetical protein
MKLEPAISLATLKTIENGLTFNGLMRFSHAWANRERRGSAHV